MTCKLSRLIWMPPTFSQTMHTYREPTKLPPIAELNLKWKLRTCVASRSWWLSLITITAFYANYSQIIFSPHCFPRLHTPPRPALDWSVHCAVPSPPYGTNSNPLGDPFQPQGCTQGSLNKKHIFQNLQQFQLLSHEMDIIHFFFKISGSPGLHMWVGGCYVTMLSRRASVFIYLS